MKMFVIIPSVIVITFIPVNVCNKYILMSLLMYAVHINKKYIQCLRLVNDQIKTFFLLSV